jgi:transcriptional regulator with XRE-family HTH domain
MSGGVTMEATEIGRRVAEIRKKVGMKQMELARRSDLSQGQVSRIERGHQGMRSETLLRIARALGVPPHELLMKREEPGKTAKGLALGRQLKRALVSPEFVRLAERMATAYLGGGELRRKLSSVVEVLTRK